MKNIRVWDPKCGIQWKFGISTRRDKIPLILLPGHQFAAKVDLSGNVILINTRENSTESELKGHHQSVTRLCTTPNGSQIVSGSQDGTLKVWRVQDMNETATFSGHTGTVLDIDMTSDGRWLISSSADFDLWVWDMYGKEKPFPFFGHSSMVFTLKTLPNSRIVVSGSEDGTIRVWEIGKLQPLRIMHTGSPVNSLVVTPDGATLVSAHADGRVQVWDTSHWIEQCVLTDHNKSVDELVISEDGTRLISLSLDGSARLWDMINQKMIDSWNQGAGAVGPGATFQGNMSLTDALVKANTSAFRTAAITPDAKHGIVASSSGVLEVHDLVNGYLLGRLDTELRGLCSIAITQDGGTIFGVTDSGEHCTWTLESLEHGIPIVKGWQIPDGNMIGFFCPFCNTWTEIAASVTNYRIECPKCGMQSNIGKKLVKGDWESKNDLLNKMANQTTISMQAESSRKKNTLKDVLPVVNIHGGIMGEWCGKARKNSGWLSHNWNIEAKKGMEEMMKMTQVQQEYNQLRRKLGKSMELLNVSEQQSAALRAARGQWTSQANHQLATKQKRWWQFWR